MTASVMRREIGEIPATVERILAAGDVDEVAAAIRRAAPRWVTIAARGTSDHAAVYAQYLVETHLGLPTGLAKPSVTTVYSAPLDWTDGLLIAISQSGRSPDIVAVTEAARTGGALTVAITNDVGSPLAAAADHVLPCHAGPELAVPATKTYVAALAVVAALVAALRPVSGLTDGIARLPDVLRGAIGASERWIDGPGDAAIEAISSADRVLVVSRGYNLATALELALKLKETCGLFAEPYSTADFAHGPLVLAGAGIPALAIRPDGALGAEVDAAVETIARRGGRPVLVGGAEVAERTGALAIALPVPEALSPVVLVVPGQLIVEATARRRGLDPDAPVGLSKVTLTR